MYKCNTSNRVCCNTEAEKAGGMKIFWDFQPFTSIICKAKEKILDNPNCQFNNWSEQDQFTSLHLNRVHNFYQFSTTWLNIEDDRNFLYFLQYRPILKITDTTFYKKIAWKYSMKQRKRLSNGHPSVSFFPISNLPVVRNILLKIPKELD